MIVADTSAIMSVLLDEPDRSALNRAMAEDGEVLVSTATAVELSVVTLRRSDDLYRSAIEFLASPFIRLVPLDEAQIWTAADAFRRYGRGRSPAGLNFGDTFSFALAMSRGLPLLFKGNDFSRTDIIPVHLPPN